MRPLASCGLFTAELLTVEGQMRVGCSESFTALLCLEGEGALLWEDGELPIGKGYEHISAGGDGRAGQRKPAAAVQPGIKEGPRCRRCMLY